MSGDGLWDELFQAMWPRPKYTAPRHVSRHVDAVLPVAERLEAERDAAVARAEAAEQAIDRYLPTVISGLYELIDGRMPHDELTDEQIAIRAAYSAAHSIAKEVATKRSAEPVYDLPSVLDLLDLNRRQRTRAEAAEQAVQRVRDETAEAIAQAIIRDASTRPAAVESFRRGMFTAADIAREHANEPERKERR